MNHFRYFAVLLTVFSTLAAASPKDRIVRIDPSRTVALQGHVHPAVRAGSDLGPVDPAQPINDMVLLFQPSPEQQADLDRLLADQQNPSSPRYHQWLTPEQFGERFGLSSGDHSRIIAWLKSQNLSVNDSARGRNWVAFSGSAEQVSRAFRTPIHRFKVNGKLHFANSGDPSVPAALAEVAGGILGLSDFYPISSVKSSQPDYTTGATHYLVPEDFATIYNLKPLYSAGYDGTGQSIAVIGQSDLLIDDVRAFRTRYGLPANDPKMVLFGSDPGFLNAEANLDVEWSGAVAPKATIYYAYGTNAFSALLNAVSLNLAPVITNSYYTCEGNASPLFYRSVAQQANAQGITILSASGDGGASGCYDQFALFATHGALQQFPASLPEVTAVGGTQFREGSGGYWAASNTTSFGSALSYIPEVAWNESIAGNIIAAGSGGASAVYSKPGWQQGPGVPDDNARDIPDISMTSAGHDGYFITYNGSNVITYGTSAAAPVMSGVIAILNQYQVAKGNQKSPGLGNINPQLYRLAQAAPTSFHDIVDGDNIVPCTQGSPNCFNGSYGYKAGPGYDLATGLGSVNVNNLITQWNTATRPVAVNLVSSLARATVNDSIDLTALVGAVSGSGVPTGVVDFSFGTTALGTVALTPRNGQGAADITIPAYLFGGTGVFTVFAQYFGDTAFNGGGNTVRITITIPASGAGIVPSVASNPVFASSDSQGLVWQETVRVRDTAGVAAILNGFTIDGEPQKLSDAFPSTAILPGATLSSNPLIFRNLDSYPVTRKFGFTGVDVTGQTWSREITALFLPPTTATAGINVTLVPLTMTQNPDADPSCQWSQQVIVDETKGYTSSISSLSQGAVSLSPLIPAIFGTTRLQAWGSLSGTLCWSKATPGTTSTVVVGMSSGLSQTLQVSFAGPVSKPNKITTTPASLSLAAASAKTTGQASLTVSLADKTQSWTASLFPSNAATSWLRITPQSGTGDATLTVIASGVGFMPGVYRGTIVIQSANAVPQAVSVPLMFVYGTGSGPTIQSIASAAGVRGAASPGMLLSIFGTQLAGTTTQATGSPLPFSLGNVSVRVNGLDAPVQYVSPGQINIQVPLEAGAGPAVLGVDNNGQIGGFQFQITPSAPGIFADANGNLSPRSTVAANTSITLYLTGDGDVASTIPTGFAISPSTSTAALPKARLPLSVTVGGVPAFIQSYGLSPGMVGVTQVTFTVPGSVPVGVQPVVVTVGSASSPPVNVTVQ